MALKVWSDLKNTLAQKRAWLQHVRLHAGMIDRFHDAYVSMHMPAPLTSILDICCSGSRTSSIWLSSKGIPKAYKVSTLQGTQVTYTGS